MKKGKLLFTMLALSLGCLTGGSGAMAQNGWDAIYSQTQTTSKSWTPIKEGSKTGKVLGSEGTTTYYYITESLDFTNDRTDNDGDGNSGLKIQGTVYLYIPYGLHLTCRGANADGRTGAGAGIELTEGNTLYLIGGGEGASVTAIGGNAASGRNGGDGANATGDYSSEKVTPGRGGNGGNGGGGAGAGIGSRGGTGGTGGEGGNYGEIAYKKEANCVEGKAGTAGGTAAGMGILYVDQTLGITVNATSGVKGVSNGKGGAGGAHFLLDFASNQSVAGGAGGGGGGYGGAGCSSGVGTGGPGGGAGGGGSSGATRWKNNPGYYRVGATGGGTGMDADGSWHADDFGTSTLMSGTQYFNNDSFEDKGEDNGTGVPSHYADGNVCGQAASNGTTNAGKKEYTITYNFVTPKIKTETVKYSPSSGTTVILPKNKDGYQWVLLVYGKDCRATGAASPFTAENKIFYGGDSDEEADRTILLKDVYGDLTFQEVAATCKLNNMGDNSQLINEFFFDATVQSQKYPITVRLKDRTMYKDNHWNTICLPFDLNPDQFAASPLAGAQVWKMDAINTGYYVSGYTLAEANIHTTVPTVVLYFEDAQPATKGLQKGKPYLVKWASGKNLVDDTAGNTHQLDFNNVTITEKTAGSWYANGVTFQGTFSQSPDLAENDKTKLVLGDNDKLYYPSSTINVGSCRGYFIVPTAAAGTRQILMGFDGDDGTTSIRTVNVSTDNLEDARIFNLSGQRLNAPQKGINIINGRKVVIK